MCDAVKVMEASSRGRVFSENAFQFAVATEEPHARIAADDVQAPTLLRLGVREVEEIDEEAA